MQAGADPGRLLARRRRPAAPGDGQEEARGDGQAPRHLSRRRGQEGDLGRGRRRGLRPDGEVRRLRLQQVARRRLLAARVSHGLDQGPFLGRVLRRQHVGRNRQQRQAEGAAVRRAAPSASTIETPDVNAGTYRFEPFDDARCATAWARSRAPATARSRRSSPRARPGGPFTSLFDFCARVDRGRINRRVVEALVKAGAFDRHHPGALLAAGERRPGARLGRDAGRARRPGRPLRRAVRRRRCARREHGGAAARRRARVEHQGAPDAREIGARLLPLGPPVRPERGRGAPLRQAEDRRPDRQPRDAAARRHRRRPARRQRPARPGRALQARRHERLDRGGRQRGAAHRQPRPAEGRRAVIVQGKVQPDRFTGGVRFNVQSVWDLAGARCRFGKYLRVEVNGSVPPVAEVLRDFPSRRSQTEHGEIQEGLRVRLQLHRGARRPASSTSATRCASTRATAPSSAGRRAPRTGRSRSSTSDPARPRGVRSVTNRRPGFGQRRRGPNSAGSARLAARDRPSAPPQVRGRRAENDDVRHENLLPRRTRLLCARPRTPRPATGFSLIEMLTTMSILAILLAIASPGLASLTSANALSSAQSELAAAMMLARGEAMKRGTTVGLAALAPVARRRIQRRLDDLRRQQRQRPLRRRRDHRPPAACAITATSSSRLSGSATVVAFNSRGFLDAVEPRHHHLCSSAGDQGLPAARRAGRPRRRRRQRGLPMSPPRRRRSRAQGGYVLLEALIAVVIAAVGFIGAARMQTFGLAMNNSAQVRQKATLLGYQMADRIRANQAGVTAHAYDRAARRRDACLAAATGCTPAQLAGADIAAVAGRDRRAAARRHRRRLPRQHARRRHRRRAAVRRPRQRHRRQALVGRQGRHAALRRQRAAMSARLAARRSRGAARGMTLVELMVGMAVGLFVVLVAISIFVSTRILHGVGAASTRMSENGRLAMDVLQSDLRNAAFVGCRPLLNDAPVIVLLAGDGGFLSSGAGLQGYRGTGTGFSPALTGPLAALPPPSAPLPTSDVAQRARAVRHDGPRHRRARWRARWPRRRSRRARRPTRWPPATSSWSPAARRRRCSR